MKDIPLWVHGEGVPYFPLQPVFPLQTNPTRQPPPKPSKQPATRNTPPSPGGEGRDEGVPYFPLQPLFPLQTNPSRQPLPSRPNNPRLAILLLLLGEKGGMRACPISPSNRCFLCKPTPRGSPSQAVQTTRDSQYFSFSWGRRAG